MKKLFLSVVALCVTLFVQAKDYADYVPPINHFILSMLSEILNLRDMKYAQDVQKKQAHLFGTRIKYSGKALLKLFMMTSNIRANHLSELKRWPQTICPGTIRL